MALPVSNLLIVWPVWHKFRTALSQRDRFWLQTLPSPQSAFILKLPFPQEWSSNRNHSNGGVRVGEKKVQSLSPRFIPSQLHLLYGTLLLNTCTESPPRRFQRGYNLPWYSIITPSPMKCRGRGIFHLVLHSVLPGRREVLSAQDQLEKMFAMFPVSGSSGSFRTAELTALETFHGNKSRLWYFCFPLNHRDISQYHAVHLISSYLCCTDLSCMC